MRIILYRKTCSKTGFKYSAQKVGIQPFNSMINFRLVFLEEALEYPGNVLSNILPLC